MVHHGDHRIYNPDEKKRPTVKVQAYALDDFIDPFQTIDLIKMDIQGAEGLALSGMSSLLARSPDLIMLLELWPASLKQTGCSPDIILSELANKGYALFEINEKKRNLIPISDIARFVDAIPKEGYCNLLISRNQQL